MRAPQPSRSGGLGLAGASSLTPMIDVVFLLIIFFLVASLMPKQDVQLDLDLPSAASGDRPDPQPRPRVTVNLLNDGKILVAGRTLTPTELTRRLSVQREEDGEDLEVRIRAARQVAYSKVEQILFAAADAGLWNVTFAVTPKQESP